jgi:hypothetical protein
MWGIGSISSSYPSSSAPASSGSKYDEEKGKKAIRKLDNFMKQREHMRCQVKIRCTPLPRTSPAVKKMVDAAMPDRRDRVLVHFSLEFYWDDAGTYVFTMERNEDAVSYTESDRQPDSVFAPSSNLIDGGPLIVSLKGAHDFLVEENKRAYRLYDNNCKTFCYKFWAKYAKLGAYPDCEQFCRNIEDQYLFAQ